MNFGAGHGGISYLFSAKGYKVVNVEPSNIAPSLDWVKYNKLSDVKESRFDLIYSSHSLEHVIDVDIIINTFLNKLKKGGIVYIEVPNCHLECDPAYKEGKIEPPHTYYFTRDFFNSLPFELVLNKSYHEQGGDDLTAKEATNDSGTIIRYIGKKK